LQRLSWPQARPLQQSPAAKHTAPACPQHNAETPGQVYWRFTQHCVWPTLVVQLPPVRQTVQWLPLHCSRSQHSLESRQESFSALQKQVPPEQVPQQQSSALVHLSVGTCDVGAAHEQKPLKQSLEQQSASRVQAAPRDRHWQVTLHDCVQQVLPPAQRPPMAVQLAQLPLSQRPLQQSPSPLQVPVARH